MTALLFPAAVLAALIFVPPDGRRAARRAWNRVVTAWLAFAGVLAEPEPAGLEESVARHPSRQKVPGAPQDGKPLSEEEERVLGRISMDALIDVAEPAYKNGSRE